MATSRALACAGVHAGFGRRGAGHALLHARAAVRVCQTPGGHRRPPADPGAAASSLEQTLELHTCGVSTPPPLAPKETMRHRLDRQESTVLVRSSRCMPFCHLRPPGCAPPAAPPRLQPTGCAMLSQVQCITLGELLRRRRHPSLPVDILVIDAEMLDYTLLRSIPLRTSTRHPKRCQNHTAAPPP